MYTKKSTIKNCNLDCKGTSNHKYWMKTICMTAVIADKKQKLKEEPDLLKCLPSLTSSFKGLLSITLPCRDKKLMTELNFLSFLTLTILLKGMKKFPINWMKIHLLILRTVIRMVLMVRQQCQKQYQQSKVRFHF